MSVNGVLEACLIAYLLGVTVDAARQHRARRVAFQLVAIGACVILALLLTNATTGRVAFGDGYSPSTAVAGMFLATLLGIGARYVFYLDRQSFSWFELLKPLSISPIVLLPLIGSIQTAGTLKDMQLISFLFLAFQNGFFWHAVLQAARPRPASVRATAMH